jgi:hypothetical protein
MYIPTATFKIIKQVMFQELEPSISKGKCPCILVVEGEIRTNIYAGSIPELIFKSSEPLLKQVFISFSILN